MFSIKPWVKPLVVADYAVTLRDVEPRMGPNYRTMTALIDVYRDGVLVSRLEPEKRIYVVSGRPTTESAVFSGWAGDLYVSLGEPDPENEGAWTTRIRYNPLASWLWIGATLMAIGGVDFSGRSTASRGGTDPSSCRHSFNDQWGES